MRKYAERWGACHVEPNRFADTAAAMLPHTTAGRKTLGEIVFHRGSIDTAFHEAAHAAFRWADMKGVNVNREVRQSNTDVGTQNEERFCDALSALVEQMVMKFSELGLCKSERSHS